LLLQENGAIVKLTLDKDNMTSMENITFDVQGREVFDPRTGLTGWSENPSLCSLDYHRDTIYGKRLPYPQAFNVTAYIDSANYFDELMSGGTSNVSTNTYYSSRSRTDGFIGVDQALFNSLSAGILYDVSGFTDSGEDFTGVLVSKERTAISQRIRDKLDIDGTYDPIEIEKLEFKLYFVDLGDVNRALFENVALTFTSEFKRYTCNGNVDTSQTVYDNVIALNSSFNGYITFFDGVSTIIPDRPDPVAAQFDETNITSDINIQLPDMSTRLNEITGTWFDPEFGYDQMTETVGSDLFLKLDAFHLQSKDVNMPFSNDPNMVTRILTIELNKSRHGGFIEFKTFWSGLEVLAGNVIEVSDTTLGWVSRKLRVVRIGIPSIKNDVTLTCVPYDANDYIEGVINPRRNKDYINYIAGGEVSSPTSVTVTRVQDVSDLTVIVSWQPSSSLSDHYDLQVYTVTRTGGIITGYTPFNSYNNLFTTSYAVADALVEGDEYEFRVFTWDVTNTRSVGYTSKLFSYVKLATPTGIALTVIGPWAISAAPTYGAPDIGQLKLFHKWYIAQYMGVTEPVFSENFLVYIGETLNWSSLTPDKEYRIWCRAENNYGTSDIFPSGNGQIFVTPDTTEEDLGGANLLPDAIDVTQIEEDIEILYDDIDQLLESLIWEKVLSQKHTTDITYSEADIKINETAVADETIARASQGTQLQANIDTEKGRVDANIVSINQVSVDADGNATSISVLQGTVNNGSTGMSATYTLASTAKTTADGAANATTILSNQVNHVTTGLSATNTLAQDAKVSADNNATAVTLLQSDINNIVGLSLDDVTVTDGSATVAVNSSEDISGFTSSSSFYVSQTGFDNTVLDVSSVDNVARTITLQSTATFDAANVTGIIKEGVSTTAELQLAVSGNTNDISTLNASFSLTGTIEAGGIIRVVGIKGSIGATTSFLDFYGDKVRFVRADGTPAIYLNIANDKFEFNGTLVAVDGVFTGTIYAENIEGDVTDTAVKTSTFQDWANAKATKSLLTFNVSAMPFARDLVVSGIIMEIINNAGFVPELALYKDGVKVNGVEVRTYSTLRDVVSAPPLFFNIPATVSAAYEVKFIGNDMLYGTHKSQQVLIQVFKQGSTIS